jgi:hypothetical protein
MSPVLMGVQSRYYDAAATADLFYPATDLTPTGSSTKVAGATGAFGAGSNVVRNTDLNPTYQALLRSEIDTSNLALTHKGDFRIWARVYRPTGNTGAVSVRLEWGLGDYLRLTRNDPVVFAVDEFEGQWLLIDLGMVHISPESTRWEFRLLAKSTVAGDELDTNWFTLFPTELAYGEASGMQSFQTPSSFSARDEFDQAAGSLAGKTAPAGGVWVEAGDAARFTVETAGKTAERTATGDADINTGAYAVSGVAAFAAQSVQVDVKRSSVSGLGPDECYQGPLARYVDVNNWLMATLVHNSLTGGLALAWRLIVRKRVAGTVATLYNQTISALGAGSFYSVRLTADVGGRWSAWYFPAGTEPGAAAATGQHPDLATGGALASGKPGFYDAVTTGNSKTRNFDNFSAFGPTPDAAIFAGQSLEWAHDGVTREDSTGSFWQRVSSFRGQHLRLAPGAQEGRSNRIIVKASRGPVLRRGVILDPETDDIAMDLFATPLGVAVPEP